MRHGTAIAALTRRRWMAGAVGATAALGLAACGVATTAGRVAPPDAQAAGTVRPIRVSDHGYYVRGLSALGSRANRNFISNAGFVVTPAGVVLIDALGSPALARELRREIARITPQPVTHVVLTHYHADHIYGLSVWQEGGARILAHEKARDYLNSDTARLRMQASVEEGLVEAGTRIVEPTDWIAGDRVLTVGGVEFALKHVGPSHTSEDLAVFVPGQGLLFAGDLVFRGRVPFVGQADSRGWIVSLDRLLELPAQVMVPGHGPHSTDVQADLRLTRDYLAHLRATMGPAARDMRPFDDAYAAADWSRFEGLPLFKEANRMNAYNTYLLMEQDQD